MAPISRKEASTIERCVDFTNGEAAITHYKRIAYDAQKDLSLVQLQLETGRTHQIRVHMSHIGHPLFNDLRYGGDMIIRGNPSSSYRAFVENCFKLCPRQALHARTLGFVHPVTGKEMFFTSEIPDDMTALIEKWRVYSGASNFTGEK